MLVASFIKACQGDVNDFCLSRSTTYRARIANRLQISDEIFQEIRKAPSQNLTLHWDGKLTKDCFGNKHEAPFVLVSETSTYKEDKLLGVQRLGKASRTAQADASYHFLEVWILKQRVKALVFDITASNTGWNNGAAKCLEKLLDKKVFFNACRHHIYELIIGAVYTCLFDDSSTPDYANFKYFRTEWPKIDFSKTITFWKCLQNGLKKSRNWSYVSCNKSLKRKKQRKKLL